MIRGLEARIILSRLVLFVEAVLPPLILPAIVILGGIATALFGIFEAMPGWLHAAALIAIVAACLYSGRALLPRPHWPSRAAGLSRIESDSGMQHRPLAMLEDRIEIGSEELWAAHRKTILARLDRLRLKGPDAALARHDPQGLRAAALLMVLIGAVIAQGDAWTRIEHALMPRIFAPSIPPVLEAWITPPSATGRPPLFLTHAEMVETPNVPSGSVLTLHVKGAHRVDLEADGEEASERGRLEDTIELHAKLDKDTTLEIAADGRNLARWPVKVIPDMPPKIDWADTPQANRRGVLRLLYLASDQYGLASVLLHVIKPPAAIDTESENFAVDLPAPAHEGGGPQTAFRDLTAHPWAGLDVILQLEAKNAQGLTGKSRAIPFTLPERIFNHPVAKQIIAERKTLAREPDLAPRVSRALSALSERPDTFNNDTIVYLSLRSAVHRLTIARGKVPPDIFDLLWNTALRIEDGDLSNAAEAMRQAQENLQQALAENRPQAEIEKLTQELRKAMDNYLKDLLESAKNKGTATAPLPQGSSEISQSELQRLLDRVQQLSRSGSRDAARELLAMIQSMLEGLNGAQSSNGADPRDSADSEAMSKLGELMSRQQQLMDKTLRESQRGPHGAGPADNPKPDLDPSLEGQQESLRKQLGNMLEGLAGADDAAPEVLSGADQAMKRAQNSLAGKRPGSAAQNQADALSKLREGTRALGEKMMARQSGRGGVRQGRGGAPEDPLGRPAGPTNEPDLGLSVTVPDQGEVERAQRIMDELRRRAGERQRPKIELDYLDRLLERF